MCQHDRSKQSSENCRTEGVCRGGAGLRVCVRDGAVGCCVQGAEFPSQCELQKGKLRCVVQICFPSPWVVDTGESGVQSQSQLTQECKGQPETLSQKKKSERGRQTETGKDSVCMWGAGGKRRKDKERDFPSP